MIDFIEPLTCISLGMFRMVKIFLFWLDFVDPFIEKPVFELIEAGMQIFLSSFETLFPAEPHFFIIDKAGRSSLVAS